MRDVVALMMMMAGVNLLGCGDCIVVVRQNAKGALQLRELLLLGFALFLLAPPQSEQLPCQGCNFANAKHAPRLAWALLLRLLGDAGIGLRTWLCSEAGAAAVAAVMMTCKCHVMFWAQVTLMHTVHDGAGAVICE